MIHFCFTELQPKLLSAKVISMMFDFENWWLLWLNYDHFLEKKAPVNVMLHHKSLKLIFCPFSLLMMSCHVSRDRSQSFRKLFLSNFFLLSNEGFPIEWKMLVLLLLFNPKRFYAHFFKVILIYFGNSKWVSDTYKYNV